MKIKERIAKLIDLKSIITLIMVISLAIGWFMNKITSEQFVPLITMILTFHFANPDNNDSNKKGGDVI